MILFFSTCFIPSQHTNLNIPSLEHPLGRGARRRISTSNPSLHSPRDCHIKLSKSPIKYSLCIDCTVHISGYSKKNVPLAYRNTGTDLMLDRRFALTGSFYEVRQVAGVLVRNVAVSGIIVISSF
jgi:hypothetical protein